MTRPEMLALIRGYCDKEISTLEKKNHDYTTGSEDPFANFTRVEALNFCTAEQGFLTRMTDKFMRVGSFVKVGTLQVKDETVEDTLLDLAAYAHLFAAYIKSKRLEEFKPREEGQ